ncbi:MAG: aminotransferase class IV [Chitinophagaceae bacterium]
MSFICFNGKFIKKNKAVLFADNRGFKYGDGIFETIRFLNNRLFLKTYHFERLFTSLQFLNIQTHLLSPGSLQKEILMLCTKNNLVSCRIRLTFFREEENKASYIIEATEVPVDIHEFNVEGWEIKLYPYARKSSDAFANLKSINYLPFVMADKYAKEKNIHEAIVVNTYNHICEGSKTNIFLYKDQQVFTPALHEGCVNGVMRRHVIQTIKKSGVPVQQTAIMEEDLLNADEVFLTNSIQVIKWVKTYRNKQFTSSFSKELSKIVINNF